MACYCSSLYNLYQRLVCIVGSKLGLFAVRDVLCQGYTLSQILLIIFMNRISRCSKAIEMICFGGLKTNL